ncbi:hypothetical protein R6Q59_001560 [Mikania micrantha]
MGDYSKDDFMQLFKRIGAYLSEKVFKILNTQDIRSVWAIAGLAVAVIFTWRLFRTPTVPQRRQPKRHPHAPSSSGGNNSQPDSNLYPSGASSPAEDSRAQTVIDEFFQPVKKRVTFAEEVPRPRVKIQNERCVGKGSVNAISVGGCRNHGSTKKNRVLVAVLVQQWVKRTSVPSVKVSHYCLLGLESVGSQFISDARIVPVKLQYLPESRSQPLNSSNLDLNGAD